MEEIQVQIVQAEVAALKLEKSDTLMIKIPDRQFRKVVPHVTKAVRNAFPDTKIVIFPDSFEVIVAKKKGLTAK